MPTGLAATSGNTASVATVAQSDPRNTFIAAGLLVTEEMENLMGANIHGDVASVNRTAAFGLPIKVYKIRRLRRSADPIVCADEFVST